MNLFDLNLLKKTKNAIPIMTNLKAGQHEINVEESSDILKYDLTGENKIASILLKNIHNSLMKLKNLHEETQKTIVLSLPEFEFINDQGNLLYKGFLNAESVQNLEALINTNDKTVEINNIRLSLIGDDVTSPVWVDNYISFSVFENKVTLLINLVTLRTEYLPLKQENMKLNIILKYEFETPEE